MIELVGVELGVMYALTKHCFARFDRRPVLLQLQTAYVYDHFEQHVSNLHTVRKNSIVTVCMGIMDSDTTDVIFVLGRSGIHRMCCD